MKPVLRFQSQLLFRKSYKPVRAQRIKPGTKLNFVFRPVRFGMKPRLNNGIGEAPPSTGEGSHVQTE